MSGNGNRAAGQARIKKKLAVLQRYIEVGVPDGAYWPRSMNQFRLWKDEDLGLEAIGSPNTMSAASSQHNADLIRDVNEALLALKARDSQKKESKVVRKSVGRELKLVKDRLSVAEDTIGKLASDWHMAQNAADELRAELQAAERRNHQLKEEISDLRAKIARLTSGRVHLV